MLILDQGSHFLQTPAVVVGVSKAEQGFSRGQFRAEAICSKLGSASYQSNGWLDWFCSQVFEEKEEQASDFKLKGFWQLRAVERKHLK